MHAFVALHETALSTINGPVPVRGTLWTATAGSGTLSNDQARPFQRSTSGTSVKHAGLGPGGQSTRVRAVVEPAATQADGDTHETLGKRAPYDPKSGLATS
jgi:hypothetical protein